MVNDNNHHNNNNNISNNINSKLYDLFISYQFESKELVDLLSKNFKNNLNYKIYFDTTTTTTTSNTTTTTINNNNKQQKSNFQNSKKIKHLNNSKCIISLVTKKYLESIECLKELNLANQTNKPLILLMLDEDLNVNNILDNNNNNSSNNNSNKYQIDLFNTSKEELIETMIESIQLNLDKLNPPLSTSSSVVATSSSSSSAHNNNNVITSSSNLSLNNNNNNKYLNESFGDETRCETFIQINNITNKKISQGILTFSNGDKYEGDLVNNKKHGHGVYTYKNGDVFDGEWVNGLKCGNGVLKSINGEVYEGEFLKLVVFFRLVFVRN